ncbi:hypothetical protein CYMTET_6534 [Cymbomonas tetramitiformis]|uniref:ABC transmembrane type-1 domain-containing protein n=1 Tax=Cymbomonas tetramitiformis TaxID=36881 RepID=A0AAE0GXC7_9CHLO|nr:hypothetical protein CYMTET_6534 [Cymbomonas tetramitiformis]
MLRTTTQYHTLQRSKLISCFAKEKRLSTRQPAKLATDSKRIPTFSGCARQVHFLDDRGRAGVRRFTCGRRHVGTFSSHLRRASATAGGSPSIVSEITEVNYNGIPHLLASFLPWRKISMAWICTAMALAALMALLPRVAELAARIGKADFIGVLQLGTVVVALLGLRVGAQYRQDVWLAEAAQATVQKIRTTIYDHLLQQDIAYFESMSGSAAGEPKHGVGDLAYRLSTDAEAAGDIVWAAAQRTVPGAWQWRFSLVPI